MLIRCERLQQVFTYCLELSRALRRELEFIHGQCMNICASPGFLGGVGQGKPLKRVPRQSPIRSDGVAGGAYIDFAKSEIFGKTVSTPSPGNNYFRFFLHIIRWILPFA